MKAILVRDRRDQLVQEVGDGVGKQSRVPVNDLVVPKVGIVAVGTQEVVLVHGPAL
jgi:hypothetical protein